MSFYRSTSTSDPSSTNPVKTGYLARTNTSLDISSSSLTNPRLRSCKTLNVVKSFVMEAIVNIVSSRKGSSQPACSERLPTTFV